LDGQPVWFSSAKTRSKQRGRISPFDAVSNGNGTTGCRSARNAPRRTIKDIFRRAIMRIDAEARIGKLNCVGAPYDDVTGFS
jgi:hypothetical protein